MVNKLHVKQTEEENYIKIIINKNREGRLQQKKNPVIIIIGNRSQPGATYRLLLLNHSSIDLREKRSMNNKTVPCFIYRIYVHVVAGWNKKSIYTKPLYNKQALFVSSH